MAQPDILVIGGGITGLSAAYECARAGAKVQLLEARHLGAMASTWTLGGVRQSGRDPAELPLAIAAVRRWGDLDEELGASTGYRRLGNLRIARTPEEVEVIHALVSAQRAAGLELVFLPDHRAIRSIAPAIGEGALAASFCPADGSADPDMTIAALASAGQRFGVDICPGVHVSSLIAQGERIVGACSSQGEIYSDKIIVAAGVHTPELLASVGVSLPLSVQRVSVVQTEPVPRTFDQVFGVANADCAGRQEISGSFRYTNGIGPFPPGAAGWTTDNLRPSSQKAEELTARVAQVLPAVTSAKVHRVWGGLIDLTPDALPVLDLAHGREGLVIGAGFSGHGFGIGPISGAILKSLAFGEESGFDLAPFRSNRFAAAASFAKLTLHG